MDGSKRPRPVGACLIALGAAALLAAPETTAPWVAAAALGACAALRWRAGRTGTGARPARSGRGARSGLEHEHRLLADSVRSCPMPYALYDENDRLLVWNDAYRRLHARAFARLDAREGTREGARGLRYGDLLRLDADDAADPDELERRVARRVAERRSPGGTAVADRHHPGLGWFRVSEHVTPMGAVAGFAMDVGEHKRREAELEREIERRRELEVHIRRIADTDELTGLANRRRFVACAEAEVDRARRASGRVCLLMMDVDHFKSVNDTRGHAAGDEVLRTVARTIAAALEEREGLVGRLGGEEFAALLPGRAPDEAVEAAERVRRAVGALSFAIDGRALRVTLSIGVAGLERRDRDVAAVLGRADQALYAAKADGRDRVRTVGPGAGPLEAAA